MKAAKLCISVILIGIAVALLYYLFEAAVRNSIHTVWNDWFNTGAHRLVVIPVCVAISLVFFGVQHVLDPASEKQEAHGLGQEPALTLSNLIKVLFIGYFSLLAGASLGPEAILVPACMVAGGLIGAKLFSDKKIVKLMSMAGFVALFAAFFHSFIAGILGLLLVKKQTKLSLTPLIIAVAVIASAACYYTLKLIDAKAFLGLPDYSWGLSVKTILSLVVLIVAGYGAILILGSLHKAFSVVKARISEQNWAVHAFLAAIGLSVLYLLGGVLVEFTGNESIVPMLHRASELGFIGLLWVLIVKIAAIGWSKSLGYRGGLVFPTVFVASVLVAIAQLAFHDVNFIYGIVAVLVGAFAADKKVKILV